MTAKSHRLTNQFLYFDCLTSVSWNFKGETSLVIKLGNSSVPPPLTVCGCKFILLETVKKINSLVNFS